MKEAKPRVFQYGKKPDLGPFAAGHGSTQGMSISLENIEEPR